MSLLGVALRFHKSSSQESTLPFGYFQFELDQTVYMGVTK